MEEVQKTVPQKQFDFKLNQSSPVVDDYQIVVVYDEAKCPVEVVQKVDYDKIAKENGTVEDWSLQALLNAGIDPKFNIQTSFNTNLETSRQVRKFADALGAQVAPAEVPPTEEQLKTE